MPGALGTENLPMPQAQYSSLLITLTFIVVFCLCIPFIPKIHSGGVVEFLFSIHVVQRTSEAPYSIALQYFH